MGKFYSKYKTGILIYFKVSILYLPLIFLSNFIEDLDITGRKRKKNRILSKKIKMYIARFIYFDLNFDNSNLFYE